MLEFDYIENALSRPPPASLLFKGQVTKQTTVKCSITKKYRGSHISLSWFSCRSSHAGRIGFPGEKTGVPVEKPSEQGKNQQRTQATYGTGPESIFLTWLLHVSNTKDRVSPHFQTSRRELKIPRVTEYI